jgi:hypothetical protein
VRRTLLASLLLVSSLFAGVSLIGPSAAQEAPAEPEGKGEVAFLHITKVVEGDGPTGGYVIEYSCVGDDVDMGAEGGIGSGGSLAFDAAGPGTPETQTIELFGPGTCTVTETDSNGASSVAYECDFVPGERPSDSPDGAFAAGPEGIEIGGCLDDQSGLITAPNDELTITVTNTFETDVLPEEPPAVDPDVVTATPTFTG